MNPITELADEVKIGREEGNKKSRAVLLAEELVISAGDEDATVDEDVALRCGKPERGQFFMIHQDVRADVRFIKVKNGTTEERYVVPKSLAGKLDYVQTATVFLGAYTNDSQFLWPIGTGNDTWSISARKCAKDAMSQWIRLVPQQNAGVYKKRVANNLEQTPDFGGLDAKPFHELLTMAFDEAHIITSLDHPIAQQMLNGQ